MRSLKYHLFVLVCIVGIMEVASLTTKRLRPKTADSKIERWKTISLDGKASFQVPLELSTKQTGIHSDMKSFADDDIMLTAQYNFQSWLHPCFEKADGPAKRNRNLQQIQVGNRDATIETLDHTFFSVGTGEDPSGPAKGFMICAPDAVDGRRGFLFVGRYKNEHAYETLQRIVGTIKFEVVQP